MKISFIVPVYQAQNYIMQCIDSILTQTYGEIEIILIHTETGDASGAICDAYAENDARVIVVHEQTSISGARNIGLSLATGDYISFVDADDWLEPSCCEVVFCNHSIPVGTDVILFDAYRNMGEKQTAARMFRENFCVWKDEQIEILVLDLLTGKYDENFCDTRESAFTTVWGRFFRRNLIKEIKFPEVERAEDLLFDLEVFQRALKVVYINKALYHYRINLKSTSWRIHREDDYSMYNKTWETYIHTCKNDDIRFREGLQIRKAGQLTGILQGYVFHPENKERLKDKKKQYLKLREKYMKSVKYVLRKEDVALPRRILLLSVRHKLFWISYFLCSLKRKRLIG